MAHEKALLEKLLESSADCIVAFDQNCRYTVWNAAMEAATGIQRADAIGQCAFDVMPLLRRTGEDIFYWDTLQGKTIVAENRLYILPKTREKRWFDTCYSPLCDADNAITGGLLMARDVTDRHRALHDLQQTENTLLNNQVYLRCIYDNAPIMMHSIDETGRICDVNHKWLEETGYTREDVIGRSADFLMTPESAKRAHSTVMPQFWQEGYVRDIPYQYVKKDGTVIDILLDCTVIADASGKRFSLAVARNLTTQKQLENSLYKTEAENRALLDTIPDLMIRMNKEGTYLDFRPAKDFKTIRLPDSMIGKTIYEVMPPDIAQQRMHYVQQALETGTPQIYEFELTLNGKTQYEEARIMVSGEDEVLVIIRDISARQIALQTRNLAENLLKEQQQFLRQVIDTNPNIIFIKDLDGRYILANQALAETYGTTIEQLIGKTDADFNPHQEDVQQYRAHDREALQAPQTKLIYEETFTDPEGKVHWFQTIKKPLVLSGNACQVLGVATEITAYKQAEAALQQAKVELEAVVEERTAKLTQANERLQTEIVERLRAEEEVRFLQSITQAIFESEDFHSALGAALERVGEVTQWSYGEAWIPRADGSALECSPIWYGSGPTVKTFRQLNQAMTFAPGVGLPGRVWVSKQPEWRQDVSEESAPVYLRATTAKAAGLRAALGIPIVAGNTVLAVLVFYMAEARQEDEQLLQLISALTQLGLVMQRKRTEGEVRQALEKEKELNELKSRFISMASHEFRTPLSTIVLSAELLEIYSQKLTEDKKAQHFDRIRTAVKRLTQLMDDVLFLGKGEAEKLQFQPKRLNLEKFCAELVEEMQLIASEKHTLIFSSQGTCSDAYMDDKLLRQIFSNLLSNAVKYSPEGGLILLGLSCEGNSAIVQVTDQGIGIPTEDQTRLYESFHRADNVGAISGTGLGLAIVKRCVDVQNGTIAVTSQVGQGTTFTVALPLVAQP